MQKYAMILDETTGSVQVGMGTNTAFYETIGMAQMDVEQAYNGQWYLAGYAPTEPEPTQEELAERIRDERDRRITACDWMIMRHRDELDEGNGTTLSADEYVTWLTYRKALRDFPSLEGFPWDGGDTLTMWPSTPVTTSEIMS